MSTFITAAQREKLIELYIGYFNRAPEAAGLNYWAGELLSALQSGKTEQQAFNDIANRFYDAGVQFGIYSNAMTVQQFITTVYQNVLGRDEVDTAGMTYWTQKLSSGQVSRGQFVQQLIAEAKAYVAAAPANDPYKWVGAYLDNRKAVGDWFANNSTGLTGQAAIQQGTAVIANSVTKATAQAGQTAAQAVAAAQAAQTAQQGQTFTLTTGTDTADQAGSSRSGMDTSASFKFTGSNEKITAAAGTLNSNDVLLDPSTSDNDVLEANIASTTLQAPTIQNIETFKLNLLANGAGLDFANVLGVKTVEVVGSGDGVLANVAATAPEVTLTGGYNKTLTVAFDKLTGTSSSNPETLKVNLNGAGSSAAVQINIEGTTNTGSLEQLTINSAGTAANTLTVGTIDLDGTGNTSYASASGISKFTVTGSQDLTLKVAHATISGKTLEKTGTGKLTLDLNRGTSTTQVTSLAQVAGYETLVLRGTGDVNVSGIVNGAKVVVVDSFAGTDADSLAVKGAATGTNDSLTLELKHKTAGTNISFGKAFAINDVETITILSNGGDSTGHALGDTATNGGFIADAAKTLTIGGDTKLTLNLGTSSKFETLNIDGAGKHGVDFVGTSAVTYAPGKNVTVNAGSASGDLTLDLSQIELHNGVSTVETLSVTTGAGADIITLGSFAGAKLVLNAGDGGDSTTAQTIIVGDFGGTGTAASDAYTSASTITTGAGKDVITVGNVQASTQVKASLAIDAGAGDNTIVVKGDGTGTANISGDVSITTGSGKDTLVFGASSTESGGATSLESSSAKVTITTGAGDDTVKLGNVTKTGSTIDLGDGADKVYVGIQATGTSAITNDVAITTGAGADTVYLYAPDAVTATSGQEQKITITDFTAGTGGDVLNLTGWVGTGFTTAFTSANSNGQAALTDGAGEKGLFRLGAFDAADIANGSSKAFNIGDNDTALAVLFNNNTGLTELWIAYDSKTGTGTDNVNIVVEKIATLENITLTGINDLKIDNFSFST